MKRGFYILSLIALIQGCKVGTVEQEKEAEKLMELSREWAQAALDRDAEKTLSFWANDAVIISPDNAIIKGHDAIRNMVEGSFDNPGFEICWEPKEAFVSISGDLGYVICHNYIIETDSLGNQTKIFGNAVEIWKKQEDSSWKVVVDIFNADPTLKSIK